MRGLEIQFGVKLINLKKQRIHLTKAGEKLIEYAEELFKQVRVDGKFFEKLSLQQSLHRHGRRVDILFDKSRRQFQRNISIHQGQYSGRVFQILVEELLNYQHDICFTGVLEPYSKELRSFRINTDEQMVFVASPKNPMYGGASAKWEQLATYPLIIQSEGSAGREIVSQEFVKRGLKPTIGTEVSNIELAKELAKLDKGVAPFIRTQRPPRGG